MKTLQHSLIELELNIRKEALSSVDDIIKVIKAFDNKTPSKRLDTALKKVNDHLSFKIEYNSFMIDFRQWDDNKRSLYYNNSWHYVRTNYFNILHMSSESAYGEAALTELGTINAENIVEQLEVNKAYYEKFNQEVENELKNIDAILKKYENIKKDIKEFNETTSHFIKDYYELTLKGY